MHFVFWGCYVFEALVRVKWLNELAGLLLLASLAFENDTSFRFG